MKLTTFIVVLIIKAPFHDSVPLLKTLISQASKITARTSGMSCCPVSAKTTQTMGTEIILPKKNIWIFYGPAV